MAPRVPLSLPLPPLPRAPPPPPPEASWPAAVANFATSWRQVSWAWMETSCALSELLKTGNFKQNYFLWA